MSPVDDPVHPLRAHDAPRGSSVRFRVVVFAVVMVLLMLGIAWPSTVSAEHQSRLTHRLTVLVGPAADAAQRVRVAVDTADGAARRDAVVAAVGEAEAANADLGRILGSEDVDVEAVVPAVELRRLHAAQERDLAEYAQWSRALPAGPVAAEAHETRTRLHDRVLASTDDLTRALDRDRAALREAARSGSERTTQIVLVTTGVALLLALLATWWTMRSLTGPILALRDTVRRQREGHRSEWARVDRGAAEVRELAADVNALTASHLELMDDQAMRLLLERGERDLVRALRDASGLETALFLVAESVAESLGVGHVVAATRDLEGENAHVQHWVAEGHGDCVPQGNRTVREVLSRVGDDLWRGTDSVLVIDDLTTEEAHDRLWPLMRGGRAADLRGSLLVVPVAVGDRRIGTVLVHDDTPCRGWRDAELAFVEGAADALARFVIAEEAETGREDYVRRLEELDRQKDTFLSTVSHELRTPLTSISGYLEMLQDGDAGELQPGQVAMLDVIERNTTRLRRLIEDLLVLNRIQNTASNSVRETVDMADVVAETVAQFREAADRQGVTVSSTADAGALVQGDRGHLSRAVSNIVANAVKFTPSGGDVDVVAAVDAQTRVVRIICTDTGMGIPDGEFPRISERFFRASNAATAQIPGTGLGLAIVRGIVESHGGRLEVTSTENAGTTVAMSLPGSPSD